MTKEKPNARVAKDTTGQTHASKRKSANSAGAAKAVRPGTKRVRRPRVGETRVPGKRSNNTSGVSTKRKSRVTASVPKAEIQLDVSDSYGVGLFKSMDDGNFLAYDPYLDELETKTWPLYTVVAVVFGMGVGVGVILGWVI